MTARRCAGGAFMIVAVLTACGGSSKPATSATSIAPTSSTAAVQAAQNLPATDQLRSDLLAAFAAFKQLPVSYFTGPNPGKLYYALLPSTGVYWALASFSLTGSASFAAQVGMQDGGDIGIFTRRAGEPWKVTGGGLPFPCPGALPVEVMQLWGLVVSGSCQVASASSPARAKLSGVTPLLDVPAGMYFGTLLYFDLNVAGSGSVLFEPETWQGNGPPVSHRGSSVSLGYGPSTTAGYWVGANASSSHEVTGPVDSTFAHAVVNAMGPFVSEPYSGYVITVVDRPGCSGACSEVTAITQISPLTPTPPNPNFTEPP
jgi:hypothetical protein